MKRDMDLIRKILFEIEEISFAEGVIWLNIEGYSPEEIAHHVLILHDAGLIKITEALKAGPGNTRWPSRLTWDGHEFLEAIRADDNWNKVKGAMEAAGGFVFELAKPLAVELVKQKLKEMGVPIP